MTEETQLSVPEGYRISNDPSLLDRAMIHEFLSRSYWSPGISRALVERAIDHSLCFAVYHEARQVGFARVVTDYASFAYLADVFVLEAHRRRGLARWLVQSILAHPGLATVRRFTLVTRDAQALYKACGFTDLAHPERYLERHLPNAYAGLPELKWVGSQP
jgi:N-acetylglutamate synthase-like GNAT family acetyltransferase